MQYKIQLPDDFDMNLIRQRVRENGTKTDGFQDLIFKAYLISTKGEHDAQANQYAPLYLWSRRDEPIHLAGLLRQHSQVFWLATDPHWGSLILPKK